MTITGHEGIKRNAGLSTDNAAEMPRITILTPSYNQGEFIEENIKSVMEQDYPFVEHIIIDGGSTDNTIDILKKHGHLVWMSEKDRGQADALNKGLRIAKGDIIGWINSDDYYEKGVFPLIAGAFADPPIKWVIGNITRIWEPSGEKERVESPEITYRKLCKNADIVKQQGVFFRKETLVSVGGFDSNLQMVMDYDLWLRLSKLSPPKMLDMNCAYFRLHPLQKSHPRNLLMQMREINMVLEREGRPLYERIPMMTRKFVIIGKAVAKNILGVSTWKPA